MKKLFMVVALAAFTLSFTACKKEYTCTCTDISTGEESEKTGKGKSESDACDDAEQKLLGVPLENCVPA